MISGINIDKELLYTMADLFVHFILAIVLALFFRWLTGAWVWSLLAVIGEILIDLDHFIDYFNYFGFKFYPGEFFRHKYQASGKCYIFLHSWEIIFILACISIKVAWVTPLAIGMAIHLLSDFMFSHRANPKALFLIYRWYYKFDLKKIKNS